ncbi:MAG TPA: adenylate/guanylate cyclase domain-containing protein [Candidatus Didemnitutus sp.]|nr:adenylate/guanylate cyclase domain-containing protein [Candidatus Didemnitutus sp.]
MSRVEEIITELNRIHDSLDPADMLEVVGALEETISDTDLVELHRHYGARAYDQSAYSVAIAHYSRALEMCEAINDHDRTARVLLNLANAYGKIGDKEQKQRLYRRCLDVSRANGFLDLEARTLMNIAIEMDNNGDLAGALSWYEKSLETALQINDRKLEVRSLQNIAAVLSDLGEVQRSLSLRYRVLDVATEVGDHQGVVMTKISLANTFIIQCDLPMALRLAEDALDEAERIKNSALISHALATLAMIHENLGNGDKAIEILQRVIVDVKSRNDVNQEGKHSRSLGMLMMNGGDTQEAIGHYRRSVECLQTTGPVSECLYSMRLLVEALADVGALEEARILHASYRSDQYYTAADRIAEEFVLAALARAEGDIDKAVEHYECARMYAIEQSDKLHELAVAKSLLSIAKQRQDFAAFVEQTETMSRLTEEIRGAEIKSRIAIRDAELAIQSERNERERERLILYSTLPKEVADRMIRGETVKGDHFNHATILFADIVGFTTHTAHMTSDDVAHFLENVYRCHDEICSRHGVTKVKTIGDCYLCFKGDASAIDNARAVVAVAEEMMRLDVFWPIANSTERLQLRIGVHSGPVTAGVIGTERLQYDLWGDTVNVASRMESHGESGRIHISEALVAVLNESHTTSLSEALIVPRGEIEIKGKGLMKTYWLE